MELKLGVDLNEIADNNKLDLLTYTDLSLTCFLVCLPLVSTLFT